MISSVIWWINAYFTVAFSCRIDSSLQGVYRKQSGSLHLESLHGRDPVLYDQVMPYFIRNSTSWLFHRLDRDYSNINKRLWRMLFKVWRFVRFRIEVGIAVLLLFFKLPNLEEWVERFVIGVWRQFCWAETFFTWLNKQVDYFSSFFNEG